jgi:hypothetical protein
VAKAADGKVRSRLNMLGCALAGRALLKTLQRIGTVALNRRAAGPYEERAHPLNATEATSDMVLDGVPGSLVGVSALRPQETHARR